MSFYDEMQDVATELLTEFNQGSIILTKSVPGAPDPATPWVPGAPIDVPYTLRATAKGVSEEFVNGTTIVATDIEITAAAFGADPDPADMLTIDGKAVTVVKIMRLPAAGTLVAWKWIVRA